MSVLDDDAAAVLTALAERIGHGPYQQQLRALADHLRRGTEQSEQQFQIGVREHSAELSRLI